MRLQKYLASIGYGSRRKIEDWIRDKRIKVNGKCIDVGYKVKKNDKISIDDKKVILTRINRSHKHIIYNKPDDERYAPAMMKKTEEPFMNLYQN